MIKFADIRIVYKKSDFSRIIYFDNDDNIKNDIEYQVNDLIKSISKISHIPKWLIKNKLLAKSYSINVNIYTIINANNLNEDLCNEKFEEFKSEPFCNNENLASFILESYHNKGFSKRILAFGNLECYWSFRRELSDYDLKNKFYKVGDIIIINGYNEPFIITWRNEIKNYEFSNTYDAYCIKNNNIQFTCDDGVHYKDIIKVIGHDLDLAKTTIINNRSEYTQEYIDKIMNMKE